jgi:flagellar hook-length control protein FliK
MQITLNVNNNNQATASFVAHHPEVRHALENAMPRLREMLGDAGIQLGQSNVSAGTPDQQAAFENGRQSSGRGSSGTSETAAIEAPSHVSHVRTPGAADGMVDTFA